MQPLFADNLEAITNLLIVSCVGLAITMPVISAALCFRRPEQAVYAAFTGFFSQSVCFIFFSSRVGLSDLVDVPPVGWVCSLPAILTLFLIVIACCKCWRASREARRRMVTVGILTIMLIGTAGSLISQIEFQRRQGFAKLQALLNGDANIKFERIETENQQRRVVITDPQVLRLLETQFRVNDKTDPPLGISYQLIFTFAGGGRQSVHVTRNDRGLTLWFLENSGGEHYPSHCVGLTKGMSPAMDAVLTFLDEPYQKVSGKVLTVSPEGIREESSR